VQATLIDSFLKPPAKPEVVTLAQQLLAEFCIEFFAKPRKDMKKPADALNGQATSSQTLDLRNHH
jgi:hypothetical protein